MPYPCQCFSPTSSSATTRSGDASRKRSPISFTQPVGAELISSTKSVLNADRDYEKPRQAAGNALRKRRRPPRSSCAQKDRGPSGVEPETLFLSFAELPTSDSRSRVRETYGQCLEVALRHSRLANEMVGSTTGTIQLPHHLLCLAGRGFGRPRTANDRGPEYTLHPNAQPVHRGLRRREPGDAASGRCERGRKASSGAWSGRPLRGAGRRHGGGL